MSAKLPSYEEAAAQVAAYTGQVAGCGQSRNVLSLAERLAACLRDR